MEFEKHGAFQPEGTFINPKLQMNEVSVLVSVRV